MRGRGPLCFLSGLTSPCRLLPRMPPASRRATTTLLGGSYADVGPASADTDDRKKGSKGGYYVSESWIVEDPTLHNASLPSALQRLDPALFPTPSRARKSCRKGEILVNGEVRRCDWRVDAGDDVARQQRYLPSFRPNGDDEKPFDVRVVYEDDFMAMVFKPAGPPTYSPKGDRGGRYNMRSAIPFALAPPKAKVPDCLRRPQPVHRLDALTSGLLCCAKTRPAMLALHRAWERRQVRKTYTAIVLGVVEPPEGVISEPIQMKFKGEKVWRDAVTDYKVTDVVPSLTAGTLSRLELRPRTGRTHQLRIHCAFALQCPIVGDTRYDAGQSARRALDGRGLFLCATGLSLPHPVTDEPLDVNVPQPDKFSSLLTRERSRFDKFHGGHLDDDDDDKAHAADDDDDLVNVVDDHADDYPDCLSSTSEEEESDEDFPVSS